MQIHIVYLPLVFFLGMTYEYWRRRRLIRRRLATIVDVLQKSVESKEQLAQGGEQDP
jgi:hypothetical protein